MDYYDLIQDILPAVLFILMTLLRFFVSRTPDMMKSPEHESSDYNPFPSNPIPSNPIPRPSAPSAPAPSVSTPSVSTPPVSVPPVSVPPVSVPPVSTLPPTTPQNSDDPEHHTHQGYTHQGYTHQGYTHQGYTHQGYTGQGGLFSYQGNNHPGNIYTTIFYDVLRFLREAGYNGGLVKHLIEHFYQYTLYINRLEQQVTTLQQEYEALKRYTQYLETDLSKKQNATRQRKRAVKGGA